VAVIDAAVKTGIKAGAVIGGLIATVQNRPDGPTPDVGQVVSNLLDSVEQQGQQHGQEEFNMMTTALGNPASILSGLLKLTEFGGPGNFIPGPTENAFPQDSGVIQDQIPQGSIADTLEGITTTLPDPRGGILDSPVEPARFPTSTEFPGELPEELRFGKGGVLRIESQDGKLRAKAKPAEVQEGFNPETGKPNGTFGFLNDEIALFGGVKTGLSDVPTEEVFDKRLAFPMFDMSIKDGKHIGFTDLTIENGIPVAINNFEILKPFKNQGFAEKAVNMLREGFPDTAINVTDVKPSNIKLWKQLGAEKTTDNDMQFPSLSELPLKQFREIGITTASENVPELKQFLDKANIEASPELAQKFRDRILDVGEPILKRMFFDMPTTSIKVDRSLGDYGGVEPTFLTSISYEAKDEVEVFSRLAQQGKLWIQDTIHISEIRNKPIGRSVLSEEKEDGFSLEPEMNITFDRAISPEEFKEFNQIIGEKGFAGSTLTKDRKGVFVYNVSRGGFGKEPQQFRKEIGDVIEQLHSGAIQFGGTGTEEKVGVSNIRRGYRQLLIIGNPESGATRTYEQAAGSI